eukprot:TRINITY_DN3043_c0_g4_i1.p1 TRINITY_DN3043_c0_g4~~TRINITY_DN3043_c0_g4_i1.p1  ORF type:complete len:468 (-),score=100.53 TRINITY_DN3043_c0_g4_i1:174-1577(-)
MSVADLRRLVGQATPRIEDVRAPDRCDFIRREHGHLPFREVIDALDALEFSPGTFLLRFPEALKEAEAPKEDGAEAAEPLSKDTSVHALYRMLGGIRILCPANPAPSTECCEKEVEQESPTSPEDGWKEAAAAAKAQGAEAFKQKDFATAIDHYTRAIKLTPLEGEGDPHTLFSNRCAANLQVGKTEEALADARKCVALAPKWPKGYFRLGSCLRQLGRLDEALAAFYSGLDLEPENKDWEKEVEKTDKPRCAETKALVQQLLVKLLPDILAAWNRVDSETPGILQLQVVGELSELGTCKWREIREGAKAGKAQIRLTFQQRKEYLSNLAANLQKPPDNIAVSDLEGQALKLQEISAFLEKGAAESGEDGWKDTVAVHLDIKTNKVTKDGKMAGILIAIPFDASLKRFISGRKEPDRPKGTVDSVLEIQRKNGFPKALPRYLGFQMFPGDLQFPVIDLHRDAPDQLS